MLAVRSSRFTARGFATRGLRFATRAWMSVGIEFESKGRSDGPLPGAVDCDRNGRRTRPAPGDNHECHASQGPSRHFQPTAIAGARSSARDPDADGAFFYSVRSTGVYCRPSCSARLPRRENVAFHLTTGDAGTGRIPRVQAVPAGRGTVGGSAVLRASPRRAG